MILVKNDIGCRRRLFRSLSCAFLTKDSLQSDFELWKSNSYHLMLHRVRAAELVYWVRGTDGRFQKDSDSSLIDLTKKGLGYDDVILLRLPIRKGRYPMLRVRYMNRGGYPRDKKEASEFYNLVFPSLTPAFNKECARELPIKLSKFTIYPLDSESRGYVGMWSEFELMDRLYPWDSITDPA